MNLPLGRELLTNRLPTNTMRHAGSELRARMERLQEKRFIHRLKRRLRLSEWLLGGWSRRRDSIFFLCASKRKRNLHKLLVVNFELRIGIGRSCNTLSRVYLAHQSILEAG